MYALLISSFLYDCWLIIAISNQLLLIAVTVNLVIISDHVVVSYEVRWKYPAERPWQPYVIIEWSNSAVARQSSLISKILNGLSLITDIHEGIIYAIEILSDPILYFSRINCFAFRSERKKGKTGMGLDE